MKQAMAFTLKVTSYHAFERDVASFKQVHPSLEPNDWHLGLFVNQSGFAPRKLYCLESSLGDDRFFNLVSNVAARI